MFKPVSSKPDFVKMEHRLLDWWYRSGLVKKYLQKNCRAKKRFSFLDGPITANNPMGVHHAWGRTLKDLYQRYRNMRGFAQRFQNGFDCQGLWVEVEAEKELGINSKKDIERYGLASFSQACKERVKKYSAIQTEQSKRLGQFMDWENSYYTYTDKNIEYIWYFLKICHQKGWLYKGFRSLPWCARCGTSLSQHELFDSYKKMTHKSIFLKFPLEGKKNEFFLVWTTTPWTLAANVALAVHPFYQYVRVKTAGEILILAKDLLKVLKDKYKVVKETKGSQLKGLRYRSPFEELAVQKDSQKVVLLWEEISNEEGTGIVHIAPGCGEEDFELGKEHNLKVIVPLDENGNYIEGYGKLTGKFAHQVEDLVFKNLEEKDLLYKIEDYTHSYPICWRCQEPIVFRAEENWFISVREIRSKMIREARRVKWHPDYVGKLMEDWLKNMGDWNISRKRYYGLPLPFYACQCGKLIIVESKKELRKLAINPHKVDKIPELHRPWIDEILIKCPNCQKTVQRIPDVGDCWLDAGIVPFSTLKYLEDKRYWRQWFPADWVSEMREQVRLWFYSMLFMAVTLEEKLPYLEVLSYEKLYDEKGKPMHKSTGNVIWFDEAAEKIGVDVIRWMYCKQSPEANLLFGYNIAYETRRQFHLLLWNVYRFYMMQKAKSTFRRNPAKQAKQKAKSKNVLDRWIISILHRTIKEVTESLNNYDHSKATEVIEDFVQELSTWYVRRSREREDKEALNQTLHLVLLTLSKILAPFTPFLADEIYQNLKDKQSVHLENWPKLGRVNRKLLAEMELVRQICEIGHSLRKTAKIKVRQPLRLIEVKTEEPVRLNEQLVQLIKEELNVKVVKFSKGKELAVELDTKITPKLKAEGEARELIRKIQDLRKKKSCQLDEEITVYAPGWPRQFEAEIKRKTLTKKILPGKCLKILTG